MSLPRLTFVLYSSFIVTLHLSRETIMANTAKQNLQEWFVGATKSGRDFLTIPPRFTEIPCGCRRELSSKSFNLRLTKDGWVHEGRGCSKPLSGLVTPYPVNHWRKLMEECRSRGNSFVRWPLTNWGNPNVRRGQ